MREYKKSWELYEELIGNCWNPKGSSLIEYLLKKLEEEQLKTK